MLIALTGTPGTGKSTVAAELALRGHRVIRSNDTIGPYILERDEDQDTNIVDTEKWSSEFPEHEGIVEGHLSHLLNADRIIVLRCRPDVLKKRLEMRGYPPEKVIENVEAEILDVILVDFINHRIILNVFIKKNGGNLNLPLLKILAITFK